MSIKSSDNLIKNDYCRNFIIEIYNEWDNYNKIIEFIKYHYKNYLAIVHDKDIWVESDYVEKKEYMDSNNIKVGDKKKIHTHIVVLFTNPRYRKTIAKELNIDLKFIQKCKRNYIINLQYLIHENNYDKYHYLPSECFGSNKLLIALKKSISDNDTSESRIMDIIRLIKSYNHIVSVTELTIDVCNLGLYGTFRNSWSICKDLLYEHNYNISDNSNVSFTDINH